MKNVLLILSVAIFAIACKKEQNKINTADGCSSCKLVNVRVEPFKTVTKTISKSHYDSTKTTNESWCDLLNRLDGTSDDLGGQYTVECN